MAAKIPVFLGTYILQVRDMNNNPIDVTFDAISRVRQQTVTDLGMTQATAEQLAGTPRTGKNGQYRFPKSGTAAGESKAFIVTDQTLPSGRAKEYQISLPGGFPLYVLDSTLSALTPVVGTITGFRSQRGKFTPLGSTVVTP